MSLFGLNLLKEKYYVNWNNIDVSFFDFPEEEDWVLIGHVVNQAQGTFFDRTLMYHHFGYQLFRKMGQYGSRSKFVELEINGTYLGVYMFMEKLKRDKNRIDIKKLEPTDKVTCHIVLSTVLFTKLKPVAFVNCNAVHFTVLQSICNFPNREFYIIALLFRNKNNNLPYCENHNFGQ